MMKVGSGSFPTSSPSSSFHFEWLRRQRAPVFHRILSGVVTLARRLKTKERPPNCMLKPNEGWQHESAEKPRSVASQKSEIVPKGYWTFWCVLSVLGGIGGIVAAVISKHFAIGVISFVWAIAWTIIYWRLRQTSNVGR